MLHACTQSHKLIQPWIMWCVHVCLDSATEQACGPTVASMFWSNQITRVRMQVTNLRSVHVSSPTVWVFSLVKHPFWWLSYSIWSKNWESYAVCGTFGCPQPLNNSQRRRGMVVWLQITNSSCANRVYVWHWNANRVYVWYWNANRVMCGSQKYCIIAIQMREVAMCAVCLKEQTCEVSMCVNMCMCACVV